MNTEKYIISGREMHLIYSDYTEPKSEAAVEIEYDSQFEIAKISNSFRIMTLCYEEIERKEVKFKHDDKFRFKLIKYRYYR